MTLKELKAHFQTRNELEELYELRANIEAQSLQAKRIDGMPHRFSEQDRTLEIAVALADLSKRIEAMENLLADQENAVREFIEGIEDTRARTIFRLRFLGGFTWAETASFIASIETENGTKAYAYRYLKKLEKEGILLP